MLTVALAGGASGCSRLASPDRLVAADLSSARPVTTSGNTGLLITPRWSSWSNHPEVQSPASPDFCGVGWAALLASIEDN